MTPRTVLLSGAGIAGSTAAYWLAREGWQVTIVEKAGGARSSGNPVDVRGAAADVARDMGIWPRLEAAATGTTRLRFVDADGRTRASIASRRTPPSGAEVEVARARLADALLASVGNDAELLVDDSIESLHDDGDGVTVGFEHASPRRFDLVLGADGLHSVVRRLVFGAEETFARPFGMFVGTMPVTAPPATAMPATAAPVSTAPVSTLPVSTPPEASLRAATLPTHSVAGPGEVVMYNEPGISLSVHAAGGSPLAAFIFRSSDGYDRRDPLAATRLIERAYGNAGWIAPELVEHWRASGDVYFDAVTRIAMPSWSRGRVCLLGDAASCISLLGEGSSNAIVAAKTLADAVAEHPGDHGAAFAAYEHAHRRRLRRYLRGAGLGARFLVPATRTGLLFRDAGLRLGSRK